MKSCVAMAASLCALNLSAADYRVHEFTKTHLDPHFWCEGANFGDFNRDGQADIVSGPYWYAGPDFKQRHEYYPATRTFTLKTGDGTEKQIPGFEGALGVNNTYSDNFFAYAHDFNGDGWDDILILGFPGKESFWFANPRGKDGHWARHLALDVTDNESPTFVDITGDGKPEIVCNSKGFFGYAVPDSANPTAPFTWHSISPNNNYHQFTHGMGYGDVNGDGRTDLLEKQGWWEQPASLEGDPVWQFHAVEFSGPGGAQMYAYDVNGDGRNDVITSLAAHGHGLAWYEQVQEGGKIAFKPHVFMNEKAEDSPYGVVFTQLHAVDLVDMDQDGLKDIVTGKRFWAHGAHGDADPNGAAVIYWFKLVRHLDGSVDWVPHLIDADSGVGTQVIARDINGDGLPEIVVGNKKGTYFHSHTARTVSETEYNNAQPKRLVSAQNDHRTNLGLTNESTGPQEHSGLLAADAVKEAELPDGFRLHPFAAEPALVQPIAFCLDDRGRVWVAEGNTYPRKAPEGEGKDSILVFEDTNGDHLFDKRTVFMEGLNLVSGMEVGFGGVWVGAAPELIFIPVSDWDKPQPAGKPQVLLDGWDYKADTHETLNTFAWGPDGWLYGCHGVFCPSHVGKPGTPMEERQRVDAAVWRYHPIRHEFEVFSEGGSNPWGVDFNEYGHAFLEACVIPHFWHIIQGAHYQRQGGQHFAATVDEMHRVSQYLPPNAPQFINPFIYDDIKTHGDHVHYTGNQWNDNDRASSASLGGGHAHAGLMVYLGDSWPAGYRGKAFMGNIHGQRINMDIPVRNGSGYVGLHGNNLINFNDKASQTLNQLYDQDGSVYIIDWYDENQCHHNRMDGHDRSNGRVYKLVYNEQPVTRIDLQAMTDEALARLQSHPNAFKSRHARRVLQQRASSGLVSDTARSILFKMFHESTDIPTQLNALWTLHVTGGLGGLVEQALESPHDTVRAWTIQLAAEDGRLTQGQLARFAKMAREDASPLVRLYIASALQRLPIEVRLPIIQALVAHGEDAQDHNLPLMYWYAMEPVVGTSTAAGMELLDTCQIAQLRQFIARRITTESLASNR
ncbi:MAG: PVC-type heme-binding CxxCH protein [Limisphaerales bacterium]